MAATQPQPPLTNIAYGTMQAVIVASLLALGGFVLDGSQRLAVLEASDGRQDSDIKANSQYLVKLNDTIADLNVTLTVLNDRLGRDRELKGSEE